MAFSSSPSSLSCTPNVTPLIDVLLVLLIIFMVIVPVDPRGLESLIPSGSQQSAAPEPLPLELLVLRSGTGPNVVYRLDGEAMDLPRLRASLRSASARSSSRRVFVGGDPALDYGLVVTAIAETKAAGFQAIGLLRRRER